VRQVDKGIYEYARYGSVGISWVLVTTIYTYMGYAGGNWLDRRFGTAPLFLVAGLLLALALSLRSLVVEVLALIEAIPSKRRDKSNVTAKTQLTDQGAEKGSRCSGGDTPER
jgi:hypothetical protein